MTQLPQPDFNFDDLRRRMTDFSTKFDAYLERGRRQVLSERNSFRARLSELNGIDSRMLRCCSEANTYFQMSKSHHKRRYKHCNLR